MIIFTVESGMVGQRFKIQPEKVIFERFGYFKEPENSGISIDAYIEFLSIIKLETLNSEYFAPILDGWNWELEKEGELVSKGSNKMPTQIRDAISYLTSQMEVSFIPGLPS
jgi:hypothetical protein